MKITHFSQANCELPQLGNAPALLYKENGMQCYITAWMPTKEDMDAFKRGQPIYVQISKEQPPMMVYTVNEKGEPNVI